MRRSSRRRSRATNDRRIRDCSNDFPENRRIAAQHAWMRSLFPGAARRRQQRSAAMQTAPATPDQAASKQRPQIEHQEEAPHHKSTAASESTLSALLSGMAAASPPVLHRQASLDKADQSSKHRSSYEKFPPVPLEISFMFSSSDGSEASFDPSTLFMPVDSDLANACDQVQRETLYWDNDEDDSAAPPRADETSWQHHYEMPDTFHNSTTTHDSTWGMTTTTLEEDTTTRTTTALVEKQRAATWSGGNFWEDGSLTGGAVATDDRSRRVRFA